MHEINSDSGILWDHTSTISAAAQELCDGSSLTEDTSTSLAVNSNSTDLYQSIQKMLALLCKQIVDDSGRISSIAASFEQTDRKLAALTGGLSAFEGVQERQV